MLALYPVTDAGRTGGSRELFGTGFGLTAQTIVELERLYLPEGVPPDDARGAILRADDLSGMPPVYLSTAGFDPLRDEGEELAARLRADGVPVVARRFAGLVHGYASFTAVSAAARDATLDAASALRAALALVEARASARRVGRARRPDDCGSRQTRAGWSPCRSLREPSSTPSAPAARSSRTPTCTRPPSVRRAPCVASTTSR